MAGVRGVQAFWTCAGMDEGRARVESCAKMNLRPSGSRSCGRFGVAKAAGGLEGESRTEWGPGQRRQRGQQGWAELRVLTFPDLVGVGGRHEGRAWVDRAVLVRPLKVHGPGRAVGVRHDGGEAEQGTADGGEGLA